jgi:uracil-DNA glycosylase family 4
VPSEWAEIRWGKIVQLDRPCRVRVAFVGEAPGAEETVEGRPFVGDAGQVLREALPQVLPEGTRFSLVNTAKCRPPGNRKPYVKERRNCRNRFVNDILLSEPELLVALGGTALEALTGQKGITKWAMVPTSCTVEGLEHLPVFPMFHPSYPLHDPTKFPELETCFNELRRYLTEDLEPEPMPEVWELPDLGALQRFLAPAKGNIGLDYETTGLSPRENQVRLIGFARHEPDAETGYICGVIPYEDLSRKHKRTIREGLAEYLTTRREGLTVCHNASFELRWSRELLGVWPRGVMCSQVGHSVLDEEADQKLDSLWIRYGHTPYWTPVKEQLALGETYASIDLPILVPYCGWDSYAALRLVEEVIFPGYASAEIAEYAGKRLQQVLYVAKMIHYGVHVDPDKSDEALSVLRQKHSSALEELRRDRLEVQRLERTTKVDNKSRKVFVCKDSRGYTVPFKRDDHGRLQFRGEDRKPIFNPNSSDQKARLLFEIAGLTPLYDTNDRQWKPEWSYEEGGKIVWRRQPSTKRDYLEQLLDYDDSGLVQALLDITDLAGSIRFIETLSDFTEDHDGGLYIHPGFQMHTVRTGRLSCSGPNLMGVKKGEPMTIFTSRFPGGKIVRWDYKQLELRIFACLSGDTRFLRVFAEGGDPHRSTGADVFHVEDEEDVTDEQRQKGKHINFGIVYGITEKGLGKKWGIPMHRAADLLRAFEKAHPEGMQWITKTISRARATGYTWTPVGRRRRCYGIDSVKPWVRGHAERVAVNTPIQNAAVEICLWALMEMTRRFEDAGLRARPIAQVHDSIEVDSPFEELLQVFQIAEQVMTVDVYEAFPWLDIEVPVDREYGPSWGEKVVRKAAIEDVAEDEIPF